jgi:PAS domain S-box-containing protein
MPLPDPLLKMAEHLMDVVWTGTGFPVLIYDREGRIIRATDKSRIGNLHAGAQKIMQGLVDEYAATPEEAARNPLVREGYSCAILIDGQRVAAFGITGKLSRTKPLARVAVKLLDAWIADQKHREELEASERKYRSIFDHSSQGIFQSTPEGRMRTANAALANMYGYASPEDLITAMTDVAHQLYIHPDHRHRFLARLQAGGRVTGYLTQFRRRDGKIIDVSLNAHFVTDPGTGQRLIEGIVEDITARKKAEERLRLSENNLRITLDSIGDAVIATDAAGTVRRMNPTAEALTGWTVAEARGRLLPEVFRIINAHTRQGVDNPVEKVLATGALVGLANHTLLVSRDGREYQIADSGAPIRDDDGKVLGVVLVFRDVTEAYRMEHKIWEHEALLKGITANIPGAVYRFYATPEHECGLRFVSEKASALFGLEVPTEEFFSAFLRGIPEGERDRLVASIRKAVENLSPWHYEGRFIKPDGDIIWFSGRSIPHQEGAEVIFDGVLMDITDIKTAQEDVRQRRQFLESVLYHAPDAIVTMDAAHRVIDWNPGAVQMFGYMPEETFGRPLDELVATGDALVEAGAKTHQVLAGQRVEAFETIRHRKDGSPLHVIAAGSPIMVDGQIKGVVAVYTDITHQKALEHERRGYEARIQQMQKMEAIGMLAGGIAHDFNNILSAVIGYAELTLIDTLEAPHIHRNIQQIHDAGMRARDLVQQILTFSRQDEKELKPLQVGSQIKEALKMLRSSLPTTIEIVSGVSSPVDNVMADPTQIHQIVMNLCTNAAQAMEETGGRLNVGLSQVTLNEEDIRLHPGLQTGAYAKLSVQDTGAGIPADIVEKIFDPYFTTKEKGKGTGLGLAVVHGIVQSYGGAIAVDSTPGRGTNFHVYLPTIKAALTASPVKISLPDGNERILLVDDEAVIVDFGRQSLERLGYVVDGFTNSMDALEYFRKAPNGYDLIITDMTMPKLPGDLLAQEVFKLRPNMPIILCTGYSSRIDSQKSEALGIRAMLMKPLKLSDLASSVRRVLDEASSGK